MYRLAVYGKGGVGKSALSSNLSYLLSVRGHRVLHVGCDPKHDSARLLTGGVPQRTFLDCLAEGGGDAVVPGECGAACVECGGAEPGIGCAGKGMTALFSYLEDHTPEGTDIRVCDVLGDVVCGGFSVPMRRGNADGILLVVNEEFMSLYAANNILRGIANLNGTACVLGLVLNSRDPEDRSRVLSFSAAAKVPIIAEVGRSPLFSKAEAAGRPLCQMFPGSEPSESIGKLADAVEKAMRGELAPVKASPLPDEAMTRIAAGDDPGECSPPAVRKARSFDTYDAGRNITYSGRSAMPACTSHGAAEALLGMDGAAVVMHGPRNCAFLDLFAWSRESYWTGFGNGRRRSCNLYCSGMDDTASFSGSNRGLRDAVRRAYADGNRYIFLIPTCASEIIGADLKREAEDLEAELPGARIAAVPSDREFLSSKWGCFGGAFSALSSLVGWDVPVKPGTVSFLGMGGSISSSSEGKAETERILSAFGLRLAPGFTDVCSVGDVLGISSSEYLLQTEPRGLYRQIAGAVSEHREVHSMGFLHGMSGTERWVRTLEELTGKRTEGEAFLRSERERYGAGIARLRPKAEGRRVVIYVRSDFDLGWRIETLRDLGMEVVSVLHWHSDFTDHSEPPAPYPEIPRGEDVGLCSLKERAEALGADIIISGDMRAGRAGIPWAGTGERFFGVSGALDWAGKVVRSLSLPPESRVYAAEARPGSGGCC